MKRQAGIGIMSPNLFGVTSPSGLTHMASTSFSQMVQILSACLLMAAMRFGVPPLRGQARGSTVTTNSAASDDTGRYFALVIGVDKYPSPIPQLHTAVKDANAIAEVLKEKYGFQTTLLTDASATRGKILDQIVTYETLLGENDNLLIYYAGHGFQIKEADKSFWLPVDATSPQSSNRISADDLTTGLATLKARHVLVVSDSCYSGGLTRDINSLPVSNPDGAFLRKTLFMRSRTIMSSGRDEPVADGGPDGHSVFAWALLQALNGETQSLFTASTLFYDGVQRAVAGNSEQIPVYQPIRNSGDIGGDFVFHRLTATGAETRTQLAAAPVGFDRGAAYYSARDFTRAVPVFIASCNKGDPRSCMYLGYLYETGGGVAQDYGQAVSLYRKACDAGNAQGCNNLGASYAAGRGVARDYGQAESLYRTACNAANAQGCSNLGYLYEIGRRVAQDYGQALTLYRKACDGGDAGGCTNLGHQHELGHGVAQDYGQALSLYRKACDAGDAQGCNNLGNFYDTGRGIAQDSGQALSLYRKACDGNNAQGCNNLGYLYDAGRGVAQDYGQTASLYRKACDGGFAQGCSNLGYLYEKAHGVAQDYGQAASLYRRACDAGDPRGCTNLGYFHETGRGVAQDYAQALPLYRQACDGGNAQACNNLGYLYETGHGIAQDRGQAASLYRKACDAGNAQACNNLVRSR